MQKLTEKPERPIEFKEEDALDRGEFVNRLANTLINSKTGRTTGIVVGITGEWGCGKSSILNLLHEHIREKFEDALVVPFDPWLISGRSDLILQFIAQLIGTINSEPQLRERFSEFVVKAADYGAHLAPLGNLVAWPGLGSMLSGGFKAASKAMLKDTSLEKVRNELAQELKNVNAPVVVLIDELDRVEDKEVRAVAQLVRAVADFQGISYVLAYDANRVIQALGAGNGNKDDVVERGRAYLEKIVQLQIPILVLSQFCSVSLNGDSPNKENGFGTQTQRRISSGSGTHCIDKRAYP